MNLKRLLLRPVVGVVCLISIFGFLYQNEISHYTNKYVIDRVDTVIQNKVSREVQLELDRREVSSRESTERNSSSVPSTTYIIRKSVPAVVLIKVNYVVRNNRTGDAVERGSGGSGFFISSNGHILTCAHIFPDAPISIKSINIGIYDKSDTGKTVKAELIGIQPRKDLAILKLVDYKSKTPYLLIRKNSKTLKVGDKVLAIGNPFLSFNWSVSDGIISGLGREITIKQVLYSDLIQTTAGISPGNSGGPLLDSRGNVIGIAVIFNGYHSFFVPSKTCLEVLKKYNFKIK